MSAYYSDTSALAKRYGVEVGSGWIRALTARSSGNELFTVALTGPELIAALVRRARGERQPTARVEATLASIRFDWQNLYILVEADDELVRRGMDVAERHALRGYDAVHLAAAIAVRNLREAGGLPEIVFVSTDQEQLRAAECEGFAGEDPNQYP